MCPLCGRVDEAQVYAESTFDSDKLNEYSFASRKLPEYMHHKLMRCGRCDILFATDIPHEDMFSSAYEEANFDSRSIAKMASRTYIRYLNKKCDRINGGRAMDIGTGEGSFLVELKNAGYTDVVGIEPSKAPIEQADETVRSSIVNTLFAAEDFEADSFDLITMFQTLEHVYEPAEVTQGIYSLLKPGGHCFLIAHNYKAFSAKLLGPKSPIFDIEHLQLFSKKGLHHLLQNAGFQNINVFPISNRYPVAYLARLFPMPNRIKRRLLETLEKSSLGQWRFSLRFGNIGAVASK